jgi:hypothetical protein
MIRNVREINWDYIGDAVPAFLTLLIIPLTYKCVLHLVVREREKVTITVFTHTHSIAYGVIAGISSYIILNGFIWILRTMTGNRLTPPSYSNAEPWVIPPGGLVPMWTYVLIGSHSASPILTMMCHVGDTYTAISPAGPTRPHFRWILRLPPAPLTSPLMANPTSLRRPGLVG